MELRHYKSILRHWFWLAAGVVVVGWLAVSFIESAVSARVDPSRHWQTERDSEGAMAGERGSSLDRQIKLEPAVEAIAVTAARTVTPATESPLATPAATLSPTMYPVAPLAAPTQSPLATDYVPPAVRRLNQIATMTPIGTTGRADGSGSLGQGSSARVWLYVGFLGSSLLLVASLILLVRHGKSGDDS